MSDEPKTTDPQFIGCGIAGTQREHLESSPFPLRSAITASRAYTISLTTNFAVPNLTLAQVREAVQLGINEYNAACGLRLTLLPQGAAGQIILASGGTCQNYPGYGYSCALGVVTSGSNFIKFQTGTRRGALDYWSVELFKSVFMHELFHYVVPNWFTRHSTDDNCIMSPNAAARKFCQTEISILRSNFGAPLFVPQPVYASLFHILSSRKMREFWDRNAVISSLETQPTHLTADFTVNFGAPYEANFPLVGNWNGKTEVVGGLQTRDTLGLYVPPSSIFAFINRIGGGAADFTIQFGSQTLSSLSPKPYIPFAGRFFPGSPATDFVGLFHRPTSTFLISENTAGPAVKVVPFGSIFNAAGLSRRLWPCIGDWDGDGLDGIGLYDQDSGEFWLKNKLEPGAADVTGNMGLTGDWIPFGAKLGGHDQETDQDTLNLYSPGQGIFFLQRLIEEKRATGNHQYHWQQGLLRLGTNDGTMLPICGDFDGDGVDQVGVYQGKVRVS